MIPNIYFTLNELKAIQQLIQYNTISIELDKVHDKVSRKIDKHVVHTTYEEYQKQVEEYLFDFYMVNGNDVSCRIEELTKQGYLDSIPPQEFAKHFGDKFDLIMV
jgi:hypothetical protein